MSEFLLVVSAFAAGAVNSIAGGGTLLTFPALCLVMNAVQANATSTLALLPGSLAGTYAYRNELAGTGRWMVLLLPPSVIGAVIGAQLVLQLDKEVFEVAVPWLILAAAVLLAVQPMISRRLGIGSAGHAPAGPGMAIAVIGFQFVVGVYGGYFGAGIGILMLASLAIAGVGDMHRMNALKTVLASAINGMAAGMFAFSGEVVWATAGLMAVAAIVGGYAGARGARMLNPQVVRGVVVVIGFSLATFYFLQR